MIVTTKWLLANRTNNKSWTKAQLKVLKIQWPPKKNWIGLVKGRFLTDQQKEDFEKYVNVTENKDLQKIINLIKKLNNDGKDYIKQFIERI